MPFVAAKANPADPDLPPPHVELTYFTVNEANVARAALPQNEQGKAIAVPLWQLKVPFGYVRAHDGHYFEVPVHIGNVAISANHTDLATIPGFLWGVLAPFGRQMRPALLHDRRCDLAQDAQRRAENEADPDEAARLREEAIATRKEADYLFRESLGAEGVGLTRRLIFWAGVSFGRFLGYKKGPGGLLALGVAGSAVVTLHAAALSAHATSWTANRWIFLWQFWSVVAALFLAVLLYARRPLIAAVLPLIAVLVATVAAGTGRRDTGWLSVWSTHVIVAAIALVVVLVSGVLTDVRVALIGVAIAPVIVPVIAVTVTAELLFALPDLRKSAGNDTGGLGPIMPTMLRWRIR